MSDVTEITQLVLRERQARDRGWWGQMRDSFHDDSTVSLSWLNDSGAEFVSRSQAMFESGHRPVHRLSPPVVALSGRRAVVEVSAAIQISFPIDGVEADLVSFTRLLYQAERRGSDWKIHALNAIYEHDTLTPSVPGTRLSLDLERLARSRKPYRYLAYHLSLGGRPVRDDLYGDDQPDRVNALYAEAFDWMRR